MSVGLAAVGVTVGRTAVGVRVGGAEVSGKAAVKAVKKRRFVFFVVENFVLSSVRVKKPKTNLKRTF